MLFVRCSWSQQLLWTLESDEQLAQMSISSSRVHPNTVTFTESARWKYKELWIIEPAHNATQCICGQLVFTLKQAQPMLPASGCTYHHLSCNIELKMWLASRECEETSNTQQIPLSNPRSLKPFFHAQLWTLSDVRHWAVSIDVFKCTDCQGP